MCYFPNAEEISVMILSHILQSAFFLWTGPPFCQALMSQRPHFIWCQICSMMAVLSWTLTTEMSTCVVSSLGPSGACLWRRLWHLVLGQAICHPMTSSLMTHRRFACNQTVCAVPTTCRYIGSQAISTAPILWEYDFICVCGQAVCNELLLWLRPDSVESQFNRVDLCEVGVRSIWLAW